MTLPASQRQTDNLQRELEQQTARVRAVWPAVHVTSLLLLGLRRVRVEFQQRLSVWMALMQDYLDAPPEALPAPAQHAQREDIFIQWVQTEAGGRMIRELHAQHCGTQGLGLLPPTPQE